MPEQQKLLLTNFVRAQGWTTVLYANDVPPGDKSGPLTLEARGEH